MENNGIKSAVTGGIDLVTAKICRSGHYSHPMQEAQTEGKVIELLGQDRSSDFEDGKLVGG